MQSYRFQHKQIKLRTVSWVPFSSLPIEISSNILTPMRMNYLRYKYIDHFVDLDCLALRFSTNLADPFLRIKRHVGVHRLNYVLYD